MIPTTHPIGMTVAQVIAHRRVRKTTETARNRRRRIQLSARKSPSPSSPSSFLSRLPFFFSVEGTMLSRLLRNGGLLGRRTMQMRTRADHGHSGHGQGNAAADHGHGGHGGHGDHGHGHGSHRYGEEPTGFLFNIRVRHPLVLFPIFFNNPPFSTILNHSCPSGYCLAPPSMMAPLSSVP
jgi:hypothetical protein